MKLSKGLTLIEAVLTIAIVGAGLIGVVYIFSGGTKGALIANQTVIASNLAREKMEQIIADRANKGYAVTIGTNYTDGQLTGAYAPFNRSVTFTSVDPDITGSNDDFNTPLSNSGYSRVTVVVTWNGGANQVKLESLIADYTFP